MATPSNFQYFYSAALRCSVFRDSEAAIGRDETDDGSVEFTFVPRAWVFAGVVIEGGVLYRDLPSQNPQFTDDILLLHQ